MIARTFATVALCWALFELPHLMPRPAAPPPAHAGGDPRRAWAIDLAHALGNAAPDERTIGFLVAWQAGENTAARFNPLATTQPAPGDSCFNYLSGGCGVRDYPDYETGMRATVETLTNGRYSRTLRGIQTNAPVVDYGELGVWGTGGGAVAAAWRQ